jgi:hypothetical protein
MAWKWYDITSYVIGVGAATSASYYGSVQLLGTSFYGLIKFEKTGPLPAPTTPVVSGTQRFYASLDFAQMPVFVDALRNESGLRLGWYEQDPKMFHLLTGSEPVGEGEA